MPDYELIVALYLIIFYPIKLIGLAFLGFSAGWSLGHLIRVLKKSSKK